MYSGQKLCETPPGTNSTGEVWTVKGLHGWWI